jgi:hypothetical protein
MTTSINKGGGWDKNSVGWENRERVGRERLNETLNLKSFILKAGIKS